MNSVELPDPPQPILYSNAVVGPLKAASNKFKLEFEVLPADMKLPHMRRLGLDASILSKYTPSEKEELEHIEDTAIYAGPYFRHFGHFIAESIHRLYARKHFAHLRKAKVAFHEFSRAPKEDDRWFADILYLCNVEIKDVIFIRKPTLFKELYVPLQGRVMAGDNQIQNYGKGLSR